MEKLLQQERENSSSRNGAEGSALVHLAREAGTARAPSVTSEVEGVLKRNPRQRFSLRNVLSMLAVSASAAEVNSVLHKLVFDKGLVSKSKSHNGRREVNVYQWRIPGHGS